MQKRLKEAVLFAKNAYGDIKRKGDGALLVLHGMEAMEIAQTVTDNEDVLIAAMLHDVVEDTGTSMQAIRKSFGDRVAELVGTDTENKRPDMPAEASWLLRKQDTIDYLQGTRDVEAKILVLGDKLSNMRSFARLKRAEGSKMWEHFNQKDPEKHRWYYCEIAKCLACLKDTDAFREYIKLTEYVFDEEQ